MSEVFYKMNTYCGKKIDPTALRPGDIDIRDIAHALSLMCRGCGQIRRFYSVGQHSLNCSYEAEARGYTKRIALACLLHDASEAFLSDIIRPIKRHMPVYYEIEDAMMKVIFGQFGLSGLTAEENALWKQIDDDMLDNELAALMPGEADRVPVQLAAVPELDTEPFEKTEKRFLERFYELTALE